MATVIGHEDLIANWDYVSWFSLVFQTPTYERVGIVSFGAGIRVEYRPRSID